MKKKLRQLMTNKWLLVVKEYEQIRQKNSKSFKTVEQLCEAFKVHRKDIRKYYERWVKSGKAEERKAFNRCRIAARYGSIIRFLSLV
ncbi:MAG: hypothetical protein JJE22_04350, partial [Bacteroidia bacterium]|nr:hypothetical protein [Bacteroidia bacterium]